MNKLWVKNLQTALCQTPQVHWLAAGLVRGRRTCNHSHQSLQIGGIWSAPSCSFSSSSSLLWLFTITSWIIICGLASIFYLQVHIWLHCTPMSVELSHISGFAPEEPDPPRAGRRQLEVKPDSKMWDTWTDWALRLPQFTESWPPPPASVKSRRGAS